MKASGLAATDLSEKLVVHRVSNVQYKHAITNSGLRTRVLMLTLCWLLSCGVGDSFAQQSDKIVSTAGSITEILYALELEKNIVGVDTTSQWPQKATLLPQVGYQRALSAEGILALEPDVVLTTSDAGPDEVLQQLDDAGLRLESFERDYTVNGLYDRIAKIGEWFAKEPEASVLIEDIKGKFEATQKRIAAQAEPKVVFLLGTEAGSAMAAGTNTSAHAMLLYSGASNALDSYEGYKTVNAEALINAAPEFLVVAAHGEEDESSISDSVAALPGVSQTPAGINKRIVVVDALRFLGFGVRTTEAIQDLASVFESEMGNE